MENAIKFRRFGTMIDCSRNAVMQVDSLKKWIDLTADLGYNNLLLYTEDTYEVDGEPYFGHLRGRYSKEELKEIDDYAFSKGMEVIPCIQTLAHVNGLFHWPAYRDILDYDNIMLAGDERVYKLIDKMFATLKQTFRSRIVNVGMDEAYMLGRGAYMDKNGYVDRFEILTAHLERVSEIAKKYGFELLMWSDMFFHLATDGDYYARLAVGVDEDAEEMNIDESIKNKIPDNINLIYWDYYSTEKNHYAHQIKVNKSIKDGIWFAGGLWTWTGFAPHNAFSMDSMGLAVESCLAHGVQDVFMTLWGDNGGECSRFAILPSLYYVAELAKGNRDMDAIKAGFEKKFGIPFDDFMLLDLPDTPNQKDKKVVNPEKYMLYSDCFMGQFDKRVRKGDGAAYAACAEKLSKWENHPQYGHLFRAERALCEVLAVKYELGVDTREAYSKQDRVALEKLVDAYDLLLVRIDRFYDAFQEQWLQENKFFGFDVQDLRFGGLIQRVKNCRGRLQAYLDGTLPGIEELEEPVLDLCSSDVNEELSGEATMHNVWTKNVTAGVI